MRWLQTCPTFCISPKKSNIHQSIAVNRFRYYDLHFFYNEIKKGRNTYFEPEPDRGSDMVDTGQGRKKLVRKGGAKSDVVIK